jgi:hypothetical protein
LTVFLLKDGVCNFVSIKVIHNFVNGRITGVCFECAFWNKEILLIVNEDWNDVS